MENLREELGFLPVSTMLNRTYKTGGYEQARNANFRQIDQDVSSGTPSFGPKYFTDMAERIL
jgi:hypothetical protein